MASAMFKPSRIVAVAVVAAAALWIVSGGFGSNEQPVADVNPPATVPLQKVGVETTNIEKHERTVLLSCVTEADNRAVAVARGDGILVDLMVTQGSEVEAGQTIAVISDEGRDSAVKQAEALVAQRKAEYDANKRLIDQGTAPRNSLPALEAAVAAADAALAAARAEADKLTIRSPIRGIVDTVPVQVGQAVKDGTEIAEIVDPDPMLAVGAISEFRRGSVKVGQDVAVRFVEGSPINGAITFVGLSAEAATRTYKIEARIANPDATIADGLTCEMSIALAPIEASAVPRSALVFSDKGELGVRTVDENDTARFVPVEIVDDARTSLWVTGIEGPTRVIVVGQDFVTDGDLVDAVPTTEPEGEGKPPA